MKSDIHPEYRMVCFQDSTTDFQFVAGSTISDKHFKGTAEVEGVEYPVVRLDISSASHPFFTGKQKLMDTEGRVERFRRKYGSVGSANKA